MSLSHMFNVNKSTLFSKHGRTKSKLWENKSTSVHLWWFDARVLTLEKVSVSTTFAQSQLVSVSTTPKFKVSKSLGPDNSEIPGLKESRSRQLQNSWSQEVSVSTTTEFRVSISTITNLSRLLSSK